MISTVKILEVIEETKEVKTFIIDKRMDAKPGQFAMIWIPRIGEKPFSFSRIDDRVGVTVREVGPFTKKMNMLKKGNLAGIRGPYGNGFNIEGNEVLIIGGGCGIAPLLPLAKALNAKSITTIIGARTGDDVLFEDKFTELGEVIVTTDDGSYGRKGFVDETLVEFLMLKKIDHIYCCGPELMLKKVADISLGQKISCQLSLERYMKCGTGICGSCSLAGLRVCKDGPVFYAKNLIGTEFGKFTRDGSGSKVTIENACSGDKER